MVKSPGQADIGGSNLSKIGSIETPARDAGWRNYCFVTPATEDGVVYLAIIEPVEEAVRANPPKG
jgi:hypothetical protein